MSDGGRLVKPVLLLDVDGVVNACSLEPCPSDCWPEWRRTRADGFGIVWAPGLVERLHALHSVCEVRWLTTWRDKAVGEITPALGLPVWPVEDEPDPAGGWWKLAVAQRYYAAGRPVAWVDDDIAADPPARRWVLSTYRGSLNRRLLAVVPDPTVGLTPDLCDLIAGWVGRWTA